MKKTALFFLQMFLCYYASGQIFEKQNIQYKGDPNKFLNIVIMGDGFTASEQPAFISKANELTNYLFSQSPWSNYKDYFNVFALKVISNQSGVKHPKTSSECSTNITTMPTNPDNFLGSSFDTYGVHRLVAPIDTSIISKVAAANFPNYDQIVIIANSPDYGGAGGSFSVVTINSDSKEVFVHEFGHSAGLQDEYFAGDNFVSETPNMTKEVNPALIKWKNWLTTPDIGIKTHCCNGSSNLWRKPTSLSCKMEVLGLPYCSVCKEGLVEYIHRNTNPLVSYSPSNTSTINSTSQLIDFKLTELMKPIPNTLSIKWKFDNTEFNSNLDSFQVNQSIISNGNHVLTATVVDETQFVKTDSHSSIHFSIVTWKLQKNSLGVNTNAMSNEMEISIFPNPTSDKLFVEVDLEKSVNLSIELMSIEGKILQSIPVKEAFEGKNINNFDVSKLASGNYIVSLKIDGLNYSKIFIKK